LRLWCPLGIVFFCSNKKFSDCSTIEPSVDLNYSARDSRRDSAHYRACSFSIVKPRVKVITIEPSADASSVKEAVRLFSMAFAQVCALTVVDKLVVSSLTHELTSAEVTAVFRGTNKNSGGASGT